MSLPDAPTNADQIEYWNGNAGQKWTSEQAALDRALAPFLAGLIARAGAVRGEHVLDVGCGCGASTLAFGEAVAPSGSALGVDVSQPMLELARRRARGREEVSFALGDAAVHAWDRQYDLVASRFGVMFFRDPLAAFANLRAALRPGGRLLFVCWRAAVENPWVQVPQRAALSLVPPPAPASPDEPGPFAFAERARVERILTGAGFSNVTMEPVDADLVIAERGGIEEALHFSTSVGPTSRLLAETDEPLRARMVDAVRSALAPHLTPAGLSLGGATWMVSAQLAHMP